MATPYPLSFLSRILGPSDVTFELQRNDQLSGSGDGRVWSSQLAPPLWRITLNLVPRYEREGREIDAKIMLLDGARGSFLFADPSYRNAGAPESGVTISAINADRTKLSFAGLPAEWAARAGDRFSIEWGDGRFYLGVFGESLTASGAGVLTNMPVMPYPPLGLMVGAAVELARPALKVFVPPGGHKPFTARSGRVHAGGSLTLIQRLT